MVFYKESDNYLKIIIAVFKEAPYRNKYQYTIKPLYGKQNLPSLFLWSLLQSPNVKIISPYHSAPLSPGMWIDDLIKPKYDKNISRIFQIFSVTF